MTTLKFTGDLDKILEKLPSNVTGLYAVSYVVAGPTINISIIIHFN